MASVALIAAIACVVLLWPKNKPAATETIQATTQQTQPAQQAQPATKKHGHRKHHSH
ncbi:MAG TPA: hypothetical protein V6D22_06815 [Candidatus Obscuribacterales bacterium]